MREVGPALAPEAVVNTGRRFVYLLRSEKNGRLGFRQETLSLNAPLDARE
jgi:hypothetical protein